MRLARIFAVLGLLGSILVAVAVTPSPVQAQTDPPAECVDGTVASSPVNWARNLPHTQELGYTSPDLGTLVASGENVLWYTDQEFFEADGTAFYESSELRRLDVATTSSRAVAVMMFSLVAVVLTL